VVGRADGEPRAVGGVGWVCPVVLHVLVAWHGWATGLRTGLETGTAKRDRAGTASVLPVLVCTVNMLPREADGAMGADLAPKARGGSFEA